MIRSIRHHSISSLRIASRFVGFGLLVGAAVAASSSDASAQFRIGGASGPMGNIINKGVGAGINYGIGRGFAGMGANHALGLAGGMIRPSVSVGNNTNAGNGVGSQIFNRGGQAAAAQPTTYYPQATAAQPTYYYPQATAAQPTYYHPQQAAQPTYYYPQQAAQPTYYYPQQAGYAQPTYYYYPQR